MNMFDVTLSVLKMPSLIRDPSPNYNLKQNQFVTSFPPNDL